jgi:hypothetical protein
MSAQLELREWTELLISIAARFFVEPQVRQLLDAGKYEEAAELCIKESGPPPHGARHVLSEHQQS